MEAASPVDRTLAGVQWRQLLDTYAALGVDVLSVDPAAAS